MTKKICDAAVAISEGRKKCLTLGRLDIVRDWGGLLTS